MFENTKKSQLYVLPLKVMFLKSRLRMRMVTREHIITIKIFPGRQAEGKVGAKGTEGQLSCSLLALPKSWTH